MDELGWDSCTRRANPGQQTGSEIARQPCEDCLSGDSCTPCCVADCMMPLLTAEPHVRFRSAWRGYIIAGLVNKTDATFVVCSCSAFESQADSKLQACRHAAADQDLCGALSLSIAPHSAAVGECSFVCGCEKTGGK